VIKKIRSRLSGWSLQGVLLLISVGYLVLLSILGFLSFFHLAYSTSLTVDDFQKKEVKVASNSMSVPIFAILAVKKISIFRVMVV